MTAAEPPSSTIGVSLSGLRAPGGHPDLALVEALARVVLLGRRLGVSVRFDDLDPDLHGLVRLCGLGDVIR